MTARKPKEPGRSLADVEAGLDMPLREAMSTQRAVRRLLPDPVDDEIVLRCVELALKAPTGGNGQNWEFIVVKDRAVKRKLAAQYSRAWTLYGGIGKAVVAARRPEMARNLRAVEWQVRHFAEIPVLVVCCLRGKLPLVPMPAIAESSTYGSIYPSVQNLLLAARAMGLGASLVTLPLWSMTAARAILHLPLTVQPCCIVPIGWPKGRYGPTSRKPVADVAHLDRYGNRGWQ